MSAISITRQVRGRSQSISSMGIMGKICDLKMSFSAEQLRLDGVAIQ